MVRSFGKQLENGDNYKQNVFFGGKWAKGEILD